MIIDGKAIAEHIKEKLKEEIAQMNPKPGLAVVLVGENPASKVYVNMKNIACEKLGIYSEKHTLPIDISQEELLKLIEQFLLSMHA